MRLGRQQAAAAILSSLLILAPVCGPASAEPPRGYGETMRWYEEAARAGDRDARFLFGYILESGVRGSADLSRAAEWYGKAARRGDLRSRYNLAVLHHDGSLRMPTR